MSITAEELAQLRENAINKLQKAIQQAGNASGMMPVMPASFGVHDIVILDALNAITAYGHGQSAWHAMHSDPNDPPIWHDPWKEP